MFSVHFQSRYYHSKLGSASLCEEKALCSTCNFLRNFIVLCAVASETIAATKIPNNVLHLFRSQIERLLEEGGGEHVKLAPCSPYQRKLIYEMTELE